MISAIVIAMVTYAIHDLFAQNKVASMNTTSTRHATLEALVSNP